MAQGGLDVWYDAMVRRRGHTVLLESLTEAIELSREQQEPSPEAHLGKAGHQPHFVQLLVAGAPVPCGRRRQG